MKPGAVETLTSPVSPLLPRSGHHSSKVMSPLPRSSRSGRENAPPADPNIQVDRPASPSVLKKSPASVRNPPKTVHGGKAVEDGSTEFSDSSVKVVVRIRPALAHEKEEERVLARKISSDSLTVEGRTFTFDSVVGPESTQEDIFQLIGLPLVKNSMAGYNTSILSYGETGSGKTYTMWGPLNSMVEENSIDTSQGIAPRIFRMLFEEIRKKQDSVVDEQISFQCRCSFLEIHNEQINDLLDPSQRNLQKRDDAKNDFYIENLTEEYVTTIQDVTQIIVKGLSSRRVGATSINTRSSRSHIVLTCIIESWCKGTSTKSFSSSKISRISLVDLAGSDRNKFNDADRCSIREGRRVHKSLSILGKLINILAIRSGKHQNIPYKDSFLTYLLRESLGGNAKVSFICTVSPDARCKSGTLSTLRFAQRAKCIQNKAIINEITEEYVNDLSNQIRRLKEELIQERSYQDKTLGASCGYFRGDKARQSLNLLRTSLNRSLALPQMDDELEEDVDINEEDVSQLCKQLNELDPALEENPNIMSEHGNDGSSNLECRDSSYPGESNVDEMQCKPALKMSTNSSELTENHVIRHDPSKIETDSHLRQSLSSLNLSVMPCRLLDLHEPTLSMSPKVSNSIKKNKAGSSSLSDSKRNDHASPGANLEDASIKRIEHIRSSLQSKKLSPTDSLAASLQRGLQIIEYHQKASTSKRTSLAFSFDHLIAKPCEATETADLGMGTSPDKATTAFICASCRQRDICSNMQIIPLGEVAKVEEDSKDQPLENNRESLTDIISRKNELERICEEQAARINQLNCLVEQYKSECEAKKSSSVVVSSNDSLLQLIRNGPDNSSSLEDRENFEMERQRWTESESRWISLTEELRIDLESHRRLAEKKDNELVLEKKCCAELDDALQRAILGHARMVEHYVELQEKHNDLVEKHRRVMEGVAQVKRAAAKAGAKGAGSAFAEALAAELSTLRVEREREIAYLKKQNRGLSIQLKDTAEAVHAAGELLVRLREAEEAVSVAERKYEKAQQETAKLRKQMEKQKKRHAMEMVTVKHCLAESRLPDSALEPLFRAEGAGETRSTVDDDQSWRTAFGPSYQ